MSNETQETRVLREAKNINLGAYIAPGGSVGNATPDYVSDYNPWEGVGSNLGRGIRGVGDAIKTQRDQAAKEAENQAESDMYLEVYNIQRTPSNMMTASQKEIEVDKVVNKYSGIVSVPKIHSILNANGAQPEKTYTRMSEQKGKEQLVAMQATQNEEMAKLAVSMDPSFAAQSPATQISAGKQIAATQAKFTASFDHVLALGDTPDEQTLRSRDGLLDETAMYASQLFPRQARVALYSGKWTPNDTQDFVNSLSMSLSQKVNPITGTVLSKQQADFYARTVADRLLAQADKERQEAMKKTVEYQNAWMDLKRNQLGTTGSAEDQSIYIMYGKDPAALEKAYGSLNARKTLREDLELIGATANGHTLIPGGVSNISVSLMAQNSNMPLQQSDARAVLTGRQASQPQSIVSNQNLLEQIDSYQEGWLNTLPSDYANQNVDALKQAIPADIQTNIQSLVQANLAPQEGEGWLQRAFRAVNNVSVGTGTTQDVGDPMRVRGANAQAINSMLNDYANKLRRIGMSEKDVKDIVSQGITMSGVPEAKGNVQNMINATANMVANGMLKGTPFEGTVVESTLARGLKTGSELSQQEEPTVNVEPAVESIGEQPKTIETEAGKVNVSSIYDTKEYEGVRKYLTNAVKENHMTKEQAANEMSNFLSKVGNGIMEAFNAVVGIKTANAQELSDVDNVKIITVSSPYKIDGAMKTKSPTDDLLDQAITKVFSSTPDDYFIAQFITDKESFSDKLYNLSGEKNSTIGIGHQVWGDEVEKYLDANGNITRDNAALLLKDDISSRINSIKKEIGEKKYNSLPVEIKAAVVDASMGFNPVGKTSFVKKYPKLMSLLKDYNGKIDEKTLKNIADATHTTTSSKDLSHKNRNDQRDALILSLLD